MKIRFIIWMASLFLSVSAVAQEFSYDYKGQTLRYTVLDAKEKTVETRRGYSNSMGSAPGNVVSGNLVIPETVVNKGVTYKVVSLGDYAFYGDKELVSVKIEAPLTEISVSAFSSCGLTSVEIPKTVSKIGTNAFLSNNNLEAVEFPKSLKDVGDYAFSGCPLKTINLPQGIETIGSYALGGVYNSITLPASLKFIGKGAFRSLSLTKIVCEGVKPPFLNETFSNHYDDLGLDNMQLLLGDKCNVDLYMASSWTQIPHITYDGDKKVKIYQSTDFRYALYNDGDKNLASLLKGDYSSLSTIVIPSQIRVKEGGQTVRYDVTSIGWQAFKDCKIMEFSIPNTCTRIGEEAFCGGGLATIVIPEGVKYIGKSAFRNDKNLREVSLPQTLEEIDEYAFADHNKMYDNKTSIGEIVFPKNLKIIGNHAFDRTWIRYIAFDDCPVSIGDYAFFYNEDLRHLQLGKGVVSIGERAFDNVGYFQGYSIDVIITPSVKYIGKNAFSNFNTIKRTGRFIIEDSPEPLIFDSPMFREFQTIYIGRDLKKTPGGASFTDHPAGVDLTIAGYATEVNDRLFEDVGVKTLKLGNEIRRIGDHAFFNNGDMTDITFGSKIERIGSGAFYHCRYLTNLVAPPALKEIGDSAFHSGRMKILALGSAVKSIGNLAFGGAIKLTDIYITNPNPPIADETCFEQYNANLWLISETAKDLYFDSDYCWYRFENGMKVMSSPVSLTVDKKEVSFENGGQIQLTATLSPSNLELPYIFWESTNPMVALIDNNGLVTFNTFAEDAPLSKAPMKCEFIARTLYADVPAAVVTVNDTPDESVGVENVYGKQNPANNNDVYSIDGRLIKKGVAKEDMKSLKAGIYIYGGRKIVVK